MDAKELLRDAEVALKIYELATGQVVVEEEKAVMDSKGVIHVVKLNRQVPPCPEAAMYWLANRQPELWGKFVKEGIVDMDCLKENNEPGKLNTH